MRIAEVISGSAGPEGVAWMLAGAPHKALRRELATLLPNPAMLGALRLRLVRLKPGRRFVAFYDATMRVKGAQSVRPIAVTWKLDGGDRRRAAAEIAEAEAEAVRRGVAAPFQKLRIDSPDSGMHVQISPLDARFPQLVRMSDPQYVHEMLSNACAASDGSLDHAPAGRYAVRSIRFRLGKRHVLRYDPSDGRHRTFFAKLYSGDDGERVCRLARQIAECLKEHAEAAAVIPPPIYVPSDAAVLSPQAAGVPLSGCLRRGEQNLGKLLNDSGRILSALHRLPKTVAVPREPHDFAAEIQDIVEASDHVCALLPPVGDAIVALLDRAAALHARLPLEPATFTFGELKAEHVWSSAAGLALIDFDGCCLGDPALDVGKFLADLRFWCAVYGRRDIEQAQDQFLAGYGPDVPPERLHRARLYEAVELVKQTVRRVRALERGWERRTGQMTGLAQSVLNGLEHRLGWPAGQSSVSWPLRLSANRHVARGGGRHPVSASGGRS